MKGISALTIAGPDVAAVADALTAISGGRAPTWYPAVVAVSGEEGRTCTVAVGNDVVELFEVAAPVAKPESLTIAVDDDTAAAAVARLRAAGFEVVEHTGPVAATVTVGGVCLRIAAERRG